MHAAHSLDVHFLFHVCAPVPAYIVTVGCAVLLNAWAFVLLIMCYWWACCLPYLYNTVTVLGAYFTLPQPCGKLLCTSADWLKFCQRLLAYWFGTAKAER